MSDVDARCFCSRCEARETRSYEMEHECGNCGDEFTATHRFGDRASAGCPFCGASWYQTSPIRRLEVSTDE